MASTPRPGAAIEAIPRRRSLTPDQFLHEYVATNQPVILEGGAPEWRHRWTLDDLRSRFGDRRVEAEGLDEERAITWHQPVADKPLGEVIDAIQTGSREWRLRSFMKPFAGIVELEREFATIDRVRGFLPATGKPDSPILWMHPAGNYSPLHTDVDTVTLNVQLEGRKEFVLIDPRHHAAVYPRTVMTSPVNPFAVDLERFPRFATARPLVGRTEPGDVVFIPMYWWHAVMSLEPSLNVSLHEPNRSRRRRWDLLSGVPIVPRTAMAILDLPGTWLGRRILEIVPEFKDRAARARRPHAA